MELEKLSNQPLQRKSEKEGAKGGNSQQPPQFSPTANPIQQKAEKEEKKEGADKKDQQSLQLKTRADNPGANPNGGGGNNPIQAKMANEGAVQRKKQNDPLKVEQGQVTFDAEGNDNENSPYFTRVLHWPGGASGVTVGRGYDLGHRSAKGVQAHMDAAGITGSQASILKGAAGKKGKDAQQYVQAKKKSFGKINHDQQKKLFEVVYEEHAKDVKRLSNKADVVKAYGKTDFDNLHPAIMEILVDLRYRGDYHSRSRKWIQPIVVENNLQKFASAMANDKWMKDYGVPRDRFNRRSKFMQDALNGKSPTLDKGSDKDQDKGKKDELGSPIGSGTVEATALNVRRGPGTNHGKVGSALKKGQSVTVYKQSNGWYQIGEGRWASGKYIKFTAGKKNDPKEDKEDKEESADSGRTGEVTASALNVRKGPGTKYGKVGAPLKRGASVTITSESNGWLKIGAGRWVYGKYVKETASKPAPKKDPDPIGTGTVTASALNVRKGPGSNFSKNGEPLKKGNSVTLLEEKNGWYRIGDGRWVSGKYIKVGDKAPEKKPTKGKDEGDKKPKSDKPIDSGSVTASSLNVRSGPGPDNNKVGSALPRGARVQIYEEQNGWYRIGPGRWVSGKYIRRGAPGGGGGGNVGAKPSWISIAEGEIGVRENTSKTKHNPRVVEYHSTTGKFGEDETPWCASFVNWVMIKSGHGGNGSAWSQAWKSYGQKLNQPAYGALVVFDWNLDGGDGHVGFVVGKEGNKILVLGGNQGNMVKISSFAMGEIVAYRYPSGVDVPKEAYNLGGAGGPVADGGGSSATR